MPAPLPFVHCSAACTACCPRPCLTFTVKMKLPSSPMVNSSCASPGVAGTSSLQAPTYSMVWPGRGCCHHSAANILVLLHLNNTYHLPVYQSCVVFAVHYAISTLPQCSSSGQVACACVGSHTRHIPQCAASRPQSRPAQGFPRPGTPRVLVSYACGPMPCSTSSASSELDFTKPKNHCTETAV